MFNSDHISILIVDDNTLVLKAYESILTKQGYNILTATNGMSALKIIEREKVSLVLLDVILPDFSGLEILRKIKAKRETEHIFVVLISSMATSSGNQIQGMELGADGYLVKPMPAWELLVRVKGFLKHKKTIDLLKFSEERYRRISEKTSEALKESNAYLRAVLENNSNIFVAMDQDYVIQFANKPAIEMSKIIFGHEIEAGKRLVDVVGNERFSQFIVDISSVVDGKPLYFERQFIYKDNMPLWLGIQYSHSTDDADNILGLFLIISDITSRKEAELLLLKYQTELELKVEERTSELVKLNKGLQREINERKRAEQELEKLSNVVEQAADHVLITDKEGIIQYVNPAFEAGTGYTKEEVIGLTPRILKSNINHPDFFKKLWETVLSGQTYRGESVNRKKDGALYYESMTVTPLFDANNNITHLVSVGSDITERRQAEADRNARDAADQANKAKSLFLANMSHEIRTPMNAIIGFSDILYASIKDEKQRSQIDAIRSSGKNLLRIINDILDLSKIEAGKMVIQYECVNIHHIISEVETIFSNITTEKGIEFLIDISNEVPAALMLDETRVRQILFNLIGNAVKFTPKGEVSLSVRRKIRGSDKIDLIFDVKDTGIGIRADQQRLVFEAFTQQDGQRAAQFGGTGLGLTITKRLVEMMGGKIQISSEHGKGSTFTVILPNITVPEEDQTVADISTTDLSSLVFEKGSVLIADDNHQNRKFLVDLLSHYPLTLIEAENGVEAVENAQLYLPEVILMDFKMPVMNGWEAMEILKSLNATKSIPIIALSASSLEVIEEQNSATLFDDFLLKPIIANDLLELLKKYIKFHIRKDSMPSEPDNHGGIKSEMTDAHKEQVLGLVKLLENDYMPIFEDVVRRQVVGQIKTFGEQLNVVGNERSCTDIADFGKELSSFANNFEISKMMKLLMTYPDLVKRLKNSCNP